MAPTYLRYHYLRLPTPTCTDLFTALPCPNAVDKWISENRSDCYHNSVLLPGYIFLSDVPCDQVLCFLSFSIDITDRRDVYLYNLEISVEVPHTSEIDEHHLSSPTAVLSRYIGSCYDYDAPKWTCIPPGHPINFRQPRGAMAEVFKTLSTWKENAENAERPGRMLQWAQYAAMGTPAEKRIPGPATPIHRRLGPSAVTANDGITVCRRSWRLQAKRLEQRLRNADGTPTPQGRRRF